MPESLYTPHASFNIYLTNKLPNLELCLLVLNAFMAQISELIRKKWERASHGGRILVSFFHLGRNMCSRTL